MGKVEPLSTMTKEGEKGEGVWRKERLPASDVIWAFAPVSMYQAFDGGVNFIMLTVFMRDC